MERENIVKIHNNRLPHDAFFQISWLINQYNNTHPGEMLPKKPQELKKTYLQGNSVILPLPEYPRLIIAHAALYPLGLRNLTGGIELFEFGSWIVHPDFRHHRINGLTIGEHVGQELIKGISDPIIATVKRENTLKAFKKLGFLPINFHEYPLTTTLTCVCPLTSEHFHKSSCRHRAQIPGKIVEINQQNSNEPKKIACTLMGHNLEKLRELEEILQRRLGLTYIGLNSVFFRQIREKLEESGIKLL